MKIVVTYQVEMLVETRLGDIEVYEAERDYIKTSLERINRGGNLGVKVVSEKKM